jgi:hypothetical protein
MTASPRTNACPAGRPACQLTLAARRPLFASPVRRSTGLTHLQHETRTSAWRFREQQAHVLSLQINRDQGEHASHLSDHGGWEVEIWRARTCPAGNPACAVQQLPRPQAPMRCPATCRRSSHRTDQATPGEPRRRCITPGARPRAHLCPRACRRRLCRCWHRF